MGKVGSYSYPDLDPGSAASYAEKLGKHVESVRGRRKKPTEVDLGKETVAEILGHESANSGAFNSKVADLRKYGVLQKRGMRITSLGWELYRADDQGKKRELKFEMCRNVPLLDDLYEEFEGREPPENFEQALSSLTGVEEKEVSEVSDHLKRLYQWMKNYRGLPLQERNRLARKHRLERVNIYGDSGSPGFPPSTGDVEVLIQDSVGNTVVVKSVDDLDRARNLLDKAEKRMDAQKEGD